MDTTLALLIFRLTLATLFLAIYVGGRLAKRRLQHYENEFIRQSSYNRAMTRLHELESIAIDQPALFPPGYVPVATLSRRRRPPLYRALPPLPIALQDRAPVAAATTAATVRWPQFGSSPAISTPRNVEEERGSEIGWSENVSPPASRRTTMLHHGVFGTAWILPKEEWKEKTQARRSI